MALESARTIRSSCLAVTFISRQFGVRINADFVENTLKKGSLTSTKEFNDFFLRQGILTKPRNTDMTNLLGKSYLFPCVGIMKTGQALILIGTKKGEDGSTKGILSIDPMDPTADVKVTKIDNFEDDWVGKIIMVAPKNDNASLDRTFDIEWFYPEFSRYKGVLCLTALMSVIIHALGIAPIIFIQISLDKVLGYEATATLYVLTAAVTIALLFLGVLSFVRDYVIDHISSAIEARLAGDAFDKLLQLPSQMFQVAAPGEMEAKVHSINTIRSFLSRQVLTNLFDATGILVFLPVLIGYSPVLALVIVLFSIVQGLVDLYTKKKVQATGSEASVIGNAKNSTLRETVGGIDTVKTLSQEPSQRRLWRDATAKHIRISRSSTEISNIGKSVNSTLMNLMTVAIIFTGINLVFAGLLSAGAIISCNMLGAKVVTPVKGLITFFADLQSISGAMEKLGSVWNANPERGGLGPQKIITGNFHFKSLSVKFGEATALNEIDGETVPAAEAFVLDNCDTGVDYEVSESSIDMGDGQMFIERVYSTSDGCGNIREFQQIITVNQVVSGCTDAAACNYDASANVDDGSCTFPVQYFNCAGECNLDNDGDGVCDQLEVEGCQDDTACNYDSAATDPGACFYADPGFNCDGTSLCVEDLNDNNAVEVGDVLLVLADFGCTESCSADLTGDGFVTVDDVLVLLSAFGSECL